MKKEYVKKTEKIGNGTVPNWKKGSYPEKVFGERHLMTAWYTEEDAPFEGERK